MRRQYREDRYMQHLGKESLDQRFYDAVTNLALLEDSAKIGLRPIGAEGESWMDLWTHVLEEYRLRFGPLSTLTLRAAFPSSPDHGCR